MSEAIVCFRQIAGLLFWALADCFLIGIWAGIIFSILSVIIKGTEKDD